MKKFNKKKKLERKKFFNFTKNVRETLKKIKNKIQDKSKDSLKEI